MSPVFASSLTAREEFHVVVVLLFFLFGFVIVPQSVSSGLLYTSSPCVL